MRARSDPLNTPWIGGEILLGLTSSPEMAEGLSPQELEDLRGKLDDLLEHLPALERDVLDLLGKGLIQRQVGAILGMSQAGVLYRRDRAIKRLRFFAELGPMLTHWPEHRAKKVLLRTGLQRKLADRTAKWLRAESGLALGKAIGIRQSIVSYAVRTSIAYCRRHPTNPEAQELLALLEFILAGKTIRAISMDFRERHLNYKLINSL